MAKKYYGGMDERRSMEYDGMSMVPKGKGMANMPQEVVMKEWPKSPYNMPEGLNDTIGGVDKQIKGDMGLKKPINSEKF